MALVFSDAGLDFRQFPNLVPQRLGIGAGQGCSAAATGRRHAVDDLLALFSGEERPLVLGVARLAAGAAWRFRRVADRLGMRVFGRRWLGGIGGVLAELLLQFIDLFLQGLQALLILLDEGCDRRLCRRRDLVPKFSRDGWLRTHAADLQTQLTEGKVGLGTSTLHCSLVTLDP